MLILDPSDVLLVYDSRTGIKKTGGIRTGVENSNILTPTLPRTEEPLDKKVTHGSKLGR